jgi:polyisoprenoid-binding protein YceI
MRASFLGSLVLAGLLSVSVPARADDYGVDPVHSSVSFKIQHMGISWIHGRFNQFSGAFTLDKQDPAKSAVEFNIKTESIDTNNKGRDTHLKSGDFFNAKQFPAVTFKSTEIKPAEGGYEVTGDLTVHGETKSIKLTLKGGDKVVSMRGQDRIGFTTDFTINRKDFGIGSRFNEDMLGNEVKVSVGVEAIKK